MRRSIFRGLGRLPLPSLVVVTILSGLWGCASPPAADTAAIADRDRFQEPLTASTRAIVAGDLEQARQYLGQARAVAADHHQQVKVDSIEHLITGTEALMVGDPDRARAAWAQIQEPHLNREVRHKARLIGIDVPIGVSGGATR